MSAGLLDTSVVIDWSDPAVLAVLPDEVAVCAITLAELAAGPHLTADPAERARRQARLEEAAALFEPLAVDGAAARAYGRVVAAVAAGRRTPRRRVADLLIAAVALANELPLYTRNARDFEDLQELLEVVAV
ncbi:MAG TPA: type II toxin-antitoxin system VapC family toxin [Candidatus Limnocylindrales bacterium]|nr:type II toxin-antitoxin system VapC family toxin [Candidatus Limnocylindrales bacterium]